MTTGWNTYGHDTGHTNVNVAVDGPVDLDQEWTLHPDVQHQPVVRNGRIYVACSNRQVSAFDVDGSGAWSYSHPSPAEFANDSIDDQYFGRGTNPVVDGATVYHLVNNRLVLLDASDGTERERTLLSTSTGIPPGDGAVQVGPAGRLYVAYTHRIYALESGPWSHVWSESTTKLQDPPAVDAAGDYLVYVDEDYDLRALDTDYGRQQWEYSSPDGDSHVYYRLTGTGQVIIGDGDQLRALDLATGTRQWTVNTDTRRDRFLPHPPTDTVFAKTSEDNLEAIDLTTGAIRWSVESKGEHAPLCGTSKYLYLRDGGRIVRRDPESGAVEERSPPVGFRIHDFVVAGNAIVAYGRSRERTQASLTLLGGREFAPSTATDTEVFDSADGSGSDTRVFGDGEDRSYCPNCGADLAETSDPNFCPQCGNEL